MVIYISLLNIITLNQKKKRKKRVLLHMQTACDESIFFFFFLRILRLCLVTVFVFYFQKLIFGNIKKK